MRSNNKKILVIGMSISLTVVIILGILLYLLLATDVFKSNQELFTKYLAQNFQMVDLLKNNKTYEINSLLDSNKSESLTVANLEYTQNINTSDENKNNPLNNTQIEISGQKDKVSGHIYKDIKIIQGQDNLAEVEYINEQDEYGIRPYGIKQFVTTTADNKNGLPENFDVESLSILSGDFDYTSIINFTETEKAQLQTTYLGILQANVSKDRYSRQKNALITVNNQDVNATAYSIKLTTEEYNNLIVKILEQMISDEIILSKLDNIDAQISELNLNNNNDDNENGLTAQFINMINSEIENIQNNNIGNDEVKVTVYASNNNLIRTAIETSTRKINIDLYNNNSSIKIDDSQLGEQENEKILKMEKQEDETSATTNIEYQNITDNDIENEVKVSINQQLKNNKISKDFKIEMTNKKNHILLNVENNTNILSEFTEEIDYENNSIKLNELDEEKANAVGSIVLQNLTNQLHKLEEQVGQNSIIEILQSFNILPEEAIEISDEANVTETEKTRFNSQFELFEGEKLTVDNIKELLEVSKNSFRGMRVTLENGQVQELDLDKMNSEQSSEADEYIKSIKEIDLVIRQNTSNDDDIEKTEKFLEKKSGEKYKVSIDYNNETGLVSVIRITIQKEE